MAGTRPNVNDYFGARSESECERAFGNALRSYDPSAVPTSAEHLKIVQHYASSSSGGAPRNFSAIEGVLRAGSEAKSNFSQMQDSPIYNSADLTNVSILTEEIYKQVEREAQLHTDINEKLGISGELSRAYRDSIIQTIPNAVRLGFDIKNLTELTTNLGEKSGKFNLISQDTMEKTLVTTRAFGTTMADMANTMVEFEKIGLGQADTLSRINNAGKNSLTLGLNSKTVLKEVQTNLQNINQYGFSKGVEGLTRMAQKSVEFRMNMSETFKIAEKVMNPESAIELTANMQMLGGAIGDLNDPLKLMYMATNNVEGLQDALHGAAAGLATYNKEQGRFEIVGANLRRAQEMAKTLGVDYKEFAKGAVAANERIAAGEALASRGLNIDDKDKEFLTNMSQMKGGEMQITIPQSLMDKFGNDFNNKTEVKLSELNQTQLDVLKQNRDALEKMNPEDLARAQFTESQNASNYLKSINQQIVQGRKNELFGRNEYVTDKVNKLGEEGLIPMARIQKATADVVDKSSKQILLGFQNTFTNAVSGATQAIGLVVTGVINSTFGLPPGSKGDPVTQKVQQLMESLYKTIDPKGPLKMKEEEERMKEYYKKGTGKDQSISGELNIKVTNIGMGEDFRIDTRGKGFLDRYV